MRSRSTGAAVLVAACLALPAGPAAAEPDPENPHLFVAPEVTVAGASVSVTGSCPESPPVELRRPAVPVEPDEPSAADYPDETVLLLDEAPIDGLDLVPLTDGGEFVAAVAVDVPLDAAPGPHDLDTGCGGHVTFEVLEAPTLDVTPTEAVRGQTVIATGTCPGPLGPVQVLLDGAEVTVVDQQADGRLGDVPVPIPDDAAAGTHTVTTSCAGVDTVEVSVLLDPDTDVPDPDDPDDPDDPAADLVPVPNLTGLTEAQAVTVLERDGLRLTDPDGSRGRVTAQDPPPGELVAVGTAVSIELAADDEATFPLLPVAGGGSLLLLVLLGAPLTVHRRRVGRERRWVRRAAFRARVGRWHHPESAEDPVPALGLRFDTELHPHPLHLEEVPRART